LKEAEAAGLEWNGEHTKKYIKVQIYKIYFKVCLRGVTAKTYNR
jgi:hypothetical protein